MRLEGSECPDNDLGPGSGTHIPLLAAAIAIAGPGPVLELGAGIYSTPLLHAMCAASGRMLWTFEDSPGWVRMVSSLASPGHAIIPVTWHDPVHLEEAKSLRKWSVVFVDHATSSDERIKAIDALAAHCELMVVHDTEQNVYQDALARHFKNIVHYRRMTPWTSVASNERDLSVFASA